MWEDNSSEILNIFIFDIIIPSFFTFAIIFNSVSRLYSSDNFKHPEYFLITFSSLSLTVDPKPERAESSVSQLWCEICGEAEAEVGGLTDSRNVWGGDGGHIYEMLEDIIVSSWDWDWQGVNLVMVT